MIVRWDTESSKIEFIYQINRMVIFQKEMQCILFKKYLVSFKFYFIYICCWRVLKLNTHAGCGMARSMIKLRTGRHLRGQQRTQPRPPRDFLHSLPSLILSVSLWGPWTPSQASVQVSCIVHPTPCLFWLNMGCLHQYAGRLAAEDFTPPAALKTMSCVSFLWVSAVHPFGGLRV